PPALDVYRAGARRDAHLHQVVVLAVGAVVTGGRDARRAQPLDDVVGRQVETRAAGVAPAQLVGREKGEVALQLFGRDGLGRGTDGRRDHILPGVPDGGGNQQERQDARDGTKRHGPTA